MNLLRKFVFLFFFPEGFLFICLLTLEEFMEGLDRG